jgi:very-short-patch-repair endonuclease
LSHRSATSLYGFLPYEPGSPAIHVTVHARHARGDAGIVVHETASLRPHEVREREGIPVTAPIRTLVDLAAGCAEDELERAVAEAFALGLTNRNALLRGVEAARGRRGVARLAELLEGERRPALTRSRPERRLLAAIRAAELPEPETNVRLGRWEVDFLWPESGLAVELDAYSTHSSPRAFERDRRKDAELSALGLSVQRFTANQVRADAEAVIAWLRAAL